MVMEPLTFFAKGLLKDSQYATEGTPFHSHPITQGILVVIR